MAGSGASVQECEDYIQQHGIQLLLKECIVKICKDRPGNPYKWLREYFDKLDRVSWNRKPLGVIDVKDCYLVSLYLQFIVLFINRSTQRFLLLRVTYLPSWPSQAREEGLWVAVSCLKSMLQATWRRWEVVRDNCWEFETSSRVQGWFDLYYFDC